MRHPIYNDIRMCHFATSGQRATFGCFCRFATSPVLRDPVVRKNHIEVRGRHSDFAALRHDVLKRFKGASLCKVGRDLRLKNLGAGVGGRTVAGDKELSCFFSQWFLGNHGKRSQDKRGLYSGCVGHQSAAQYCLRISFLRILPEPLLGSGSWTMVTMRGYL